MSRFLHFVVLVLLISPLSFVAQMSTNSAKGERLKIDLNDATLFKKSVKNVVSEALTKEKKQNFTPEPLEFVFKPKLQLGTGMFTFYGDVGSNHQWYHPTVSRLGYDLRLINPIDEYFDLSFYVLFGQVSASERTLTRNANFNSHITTGGMTVSYNFGNLFKNMPHGTPYISAGIESVEFLSKSDLQDANGNYYHYWSDGRIMDMAEDAPNAAANATELYRDYTYESDLRELNLDGFSKYQERTWAIPVELGAALYITPRVNFRIGTSMHFTFTDLIDNITEESLGDRKGDKRNDRFLYTHFALTYDLTWGDGETEIPIDDEFFEGDTIDSDGDLVTDLNDRCAKTPEDGRPVDEFGCPIDDDNDGVGNYKDLEWETEDSALVNIHGQTWTLDSMNLHYRMYKDSIGEFATMETVRDTLHVAQMAPPAHHYHYWLVMGTDTTEFSANEMAALLGNKTYRRIEDGDDFYHVVKLGTETGDGGDGDVLVVTPDTTSEGGGDVVTVVELTQEQRDSIAEAQRLAEHINDEHLPNTFLYRVQIGAFHREIKSSVFEGLPNLEHMVGEDGLHRYYTGLFDSKKTTVEHRAKMLEQGFIGAFMVAFKDGKRVTLGTSGFTVLPGFDDNIIDDTVATEGVVVEGAIKFRINVGDFKGTIPTEVLDVYLTIGNVMPIRNTATGVTSYYMGDFNNFEEAEDFMKSIEQEGIMGPYVVGDFNGNIISEQAAQDLLNQ